MRSTHNRSGPGEGSSLKSIRTSSGQAGPTITHQKMGRPRLSLYLTLLSLKFSSVPLDTAVTNRVRMDPQKYPLCPFVWSWSLH